MRWNIHVAVSRSRHDMEVMASALSSFLINDGMVVVEVEVVVVRR
jgi:hypothetical protein